jgi:hypothetical protein
VTLTLCLLYLQGKSPRYPLDRRLGDPQKYAVERRIFAHKRVVEIQ